MSKLTEAFIMGVAATIATEALMFILGEVNTTDKNGNSKVLWKGPFYKKFIFNAVSNKKGDS